MMRTKYHYCVLRGRPGRGGSLLSDALSAAASPLSKSQHSTVHSTAQLCCVCP
eukprot:COSAG01_NODE_156_length_23748_cov_439.062371_3_plen_53_part_00